MARIKIIYGPMFSGKSAILIDLIEESKLKNEDILVFKPKSDKRTKNIYSRNGKTYKAISIEFVREILDYDLKDIKKIFIDEINFFTNSFKLDLEELVKRDIDVIVSGLERDYRTMFFPYVKEILDIAEEKILLEGRCFFCDNKAIYTGRKINGKFDVIDSPTIISEDLKDKSVVEYFSSCKMHHPLIKNIKED